MVSPVFGFIRPSTSSIPTTLFVCLQKMVLCLPGRRKFSDIAYFNGTETEFRLPHKSQNPRSVKKTIMIRSLLLTTGLLLAFSFASQAQLLPVIANDTIICPGESVQLAEAPNPPTDFTYRWTPSTGLNNDTLPNPIATPEFTTEYQLIVTSADSSQMDTAEVLITVRNVNVTISVNSEELCLGDSLDLGVLATGPASTIIWSSSNGTISDTGSISFPLYVPTETETFFVQHTDQSCTVFDTLTVFVDSLPASTIRLEPVKEIYCPGDTVILLSDTYEPQDFPVLEPLWSPAIGFESADSLWNMIITAQTTTTFQRNITNRGCTAVDSIEVPVDTLIELNLNTASICPGESVQLEIVQGFKPEGTLTWMPIDGLSCTDCPNPIASPIVTTSYMVQQQDVPCPSGADVTVAVTEPPLALVSDQTICEGDTLILNTFENPGAIYTWTSTPTDPSLNPTDPFGRVSPIANTTYMVTAELNGCTFMDEVTITVINAANLQVTPFPDTTVSSGGTATLFATSGQTGLNETFSWTLNPGGVLDGPQQTVENVTQNISVTLNYTNQCGTDTVNLEILVLQVLVPGAFTPNGDTDNDFFNIVSSGDPNVLQFRVWNRWGQLVYDNETPDQGWDGMFNDSPAPSDVYVYRVVVELPDGTEEEFKGDVTLIR